MRRDVRAEPGEGSAAAKDAGGIRLNKLLASRGIGARRKCDALIEAGSVRVNGTVVKEPGVRVMADRDRIEVHGRPIPGRATLRYLMVHKPVGVITTLEDPEGRPTVRTLLPPGPRLFPVGRLDAETSGLIVVTNDGELAHHLMHPRYGVRKVYRVRLDRVPEADQIRRLREGVEFEPKIVSAPCEVRVRNSRAERPEIEMMLHEGRYRQVRRMCEAVGLRVVKLHRPNYGPLALGELPRGAWRELTAEEVRRLKEASARPLPKPRRAPLPRRPEVHDAGAREAPRAVPGRAPMGARRAVPARTHRGAAHEARRSRPERSRPQRSRPERSRPQRSRPERSRPQRARPQRPQSPGSRFARGSRPGESAGRAGRTGPRSGRQSASSSRRPRAKRPPTSRTRPRSGRPTY